MFEFWKIYKAQTLAIRCLQPFVDYSKTHSPTAKTDNWQKPHILGFIATIITLMTDRFSGSIQSSSLANIQSSTLANLTNTGREFIGEKMYLLSSINDPSFQNGCKNGYDFFISIEFIELHEAENLFSAWFNKITQMPLGLTYTSPNEQKLNPILLSKWIDNVDEKFNEN